MKSGEGEVDDLAEVLVDGVDAFASGGSDAIPESIDDLVQFLGGVFSVLGPFQQTLDLLDHLVATGREAAHLHTPPSTVLFWFTTLCRYPFVSYNSFFRLSRVLVSDRCFSSKISM